MTAKLFDVYKLRKIVILLLDRKLLACSLCRSRSRCLYAVLLFHQSYRFFAVILHSFYTNLQCYNVANLSKFSVNWFRYCSLSLLCPFWIRPYPFSHKQWAHTLCKTTDSYASSIQRLANVYLTIAATHYVYCITYYVTMDVRLYVYAVVCMGLCMNFKSFYARVAQLCRFF